MCTGSHIQADAWRSEEDVSVLLHDHPVSCLLPIAPGLQACVRPHLAFYVGSRIQMQVSMLVQQVLLLTQSFSSSQQGSLTDPQLVFREAGHEHQASLPEG